MTTKINGRTPEEIKNGLECCVYENAYCEICPFKDITGLRCISHMADCVYAYIQQLEKHIGELTEKVAQLDQVTRERDALLGLVKELGECNYCKHDSYCPHTIPDCMNCKDENCKCYSCGHQSKWQWRGVQEVE